MKNIFLSLLIVFSLFLLNGSSEAADELYIITTKDGSAIVAKKYWFTDEYVKFTTETGLPGYIKRTEFLKIDNMVGVPTERQEPAGEREGLVGSVSSSWAFSGAILAVLIVLMVYFLSRKKTAHTGKEMEQKGGGHLSFEYREPLGRISNWTIEVRSAYEEDGVLYIEGFCVKTDKRKKFRADRVVGPVTDMSNDKQEPTLGHFFTGAK